MLNRCKWSSQTFENFSSYSGIYRDNCELYGQSIVFFANLAFFFSEFVSINLLIPYSSPHLHLFGRGGLLFIYRSCFWRPGANCNQHIFSDRYKSFRKPRYQYSKGYILSYFIHLTYRTRPVLHLVRRFAFNGLGCLARSDNDHRGFRCCSGCSGFRNSNFCLFLYFRFHTLGKGLTDILNISLSLPKIGTGAECFCRWFLGMWRIPFEVRVRKCGAEYNVYC